MNATKPLPAAYYHARCVAAFYLWQALRGDILTGGDPVTGQPKSAPWSRRSGWRDASRAAYKALYRFWRARAESIRETERGAR